MTTPLTVAIAEKTPHRLPDRLIPLSELRKHCTAESLWMSFRGGVYDMTDFVEGHPGLKTRLLLAGGKSVEPFWKVYPDHFRGHVIPWMQRFKIGRLSPEDAKEARNFVFADAYQNDPERHLDLLVNTEHPFNGEPLLERLTENYYTPNELHFVRSHLPIPDLKVDDYRLTVRGHRTLSKTSREETFVFTLDQLKSNFEKYTVSYTMQCAGNRREDFHGQKHQMFIGPHWVAAAISNAEWAGARLCEILAYCGLNVEDMAMQRLRYDDVTNVHFTGFDSDETGLEYGVSIPISTAVNPLYGAMVVYEMNGEPIPRDHGFPVRAIVPGFAGARSCKWLKEIELSDHVSRKPWQWNAYRGFAPDVHFDEELYKWTKSDKVRLDQAPIVEEMPVQSLICNPPSGSTVGIATTLDRLEVRGICWSGGGRGIHRCDVSLDGGENFSAAELYKPERLRKEERREAKWGWYIFSKVVELPAKIVDQLKQGRKVQLELCSKAVNGDFNVQPERPEPYFNARGVVVNHWYRVPVTIDPSFRPGQVLKKEQREFRNKPSGSNFIKPWILRQMKRKGETKRKRKTKRIRSLL